MQVGVLKLAQAGGDPRGGFLGVSIATVHQRDPLVPSWAVRFGGIVCAIELNWSNNQQEFERIYKIYENKS